jgi:hypothetical protein
MNFYFGRAPDKSGPGYSLQVLIALRAFHCYPSREEMQLLSCRSVNYELRFIKNTNKKSFGMDLTANEILQENNIESIKIGYCKYNLRFNGKEILRPENPRNCYQLLKDEFGIDEPRFKKF